MPNLLQTLNRVQYTGFDFNTILDELLSRVQVKFGGVFNDFTLSSLGVVLADQQAYGLDSLAFYLDRRASNLYVSTARTRDATARNTRQLGYKMSAAVASSVDLQVSLLQAYAFSVTIPLAFAFENEDGVLFEAAEAVTFAPGEQGPKTVPCYEGTTQTETFVSTGLANQEFELRRVPSGKAIVRGRTLVLVDGSPWIEKEFVTFEQSDHYELATEQDPPILRFGDGVAGNIPLTGATIRISYVASLGAGGRVAANTITAPQTALVVSFQRIEMSVNNPEGASGGDDAEPLAKAKAFAGRVFKSRGVAVTEGDYDAQAGSFADPLGGRVSVARAFVSRTSQDDLTLKGYLSDIEEAVDEPLPIVSVEVAAVRVALATMSAATEEITAIVEDSQAITQGAYTN